MPPPRPLADLQDGGAAAACRVLDLGPAHPALKHVGDAGVALGVLGAALVAALVLGLGDALRLPAAAVVVILASNSREHIQQHAVDRIEHPAGELIAVACG